MKVLVVQDHFRLGGRETFLLTVARALRERGLGLHLLAETVSAPREVLEVFDGVTVRAGGLEALPAVVAGLRDVSLVWGHHFQLLEAWAASRYLQKPLCAHFHGPLAGDNRPNSLWESLGMTLAIHRGEGICAVSEETAESILRVAPGVGAPVIVRNMIAGDADLVSAAGAVRKAEVLLPTRIEKLGHLRAAFSLFCAGKSRGLFSRMTILGARRGGTGEISRRGPFAAGSLFGWRWLLQGNFSRVAALPAVRVEDGVWETERYLERAGVVFGMGRAALEGIARGRPAVLVGYDAALDVIDGENFAMFSRSNFSGRGVGVKSVEEILGRLAAKRPVISAAEWAAFDSGRACGELAAHFQALATRPVSGRQKALEIMEASSAGSPEEALFALAVKDFSAGELRTLYLLTKG